MAEQQASIPFRETLALLASAGVVTGVLYLVGHAWIWGRNGRFGVPAREFAIDHTEYIIVGFNESLPFFFGIALAALVTAWLFCREAKITLTDETHQQHILAYCAIAGLMTAAISLADVNTPPIVLFGFDLTVSLFQIAIAVSTALFATLVMVAMTGTWGGALRPILGRTFSGNIVLALIATIGLVGGASIAGSTRAGDELWNLADHQEVTLTFENETEATYFFVAHANAAYYVRDLSDVGGTTTGIIIIPGSKVAEAQIFKHKGNLS